MMILLKSVINIADNFSVKSKVVNNDLEADAEISSRPMGHQTQVHTVPLQTLCLRCACPPNPIFWSLDVTHVYPKSIN